jgi:hypothetical protein
LRNPGIVALNKPFFMNIPVSPSTEGQTDPDQTDVASVFPTIGLSPDEGAGLTNVAATIALVVEGGEGDETEALQKAKLAVTEVKEALQVVRDAITALREDLHDVHHDLEHEHHHAHEPETARFKELKIPLFGKFNFQIPNPEIGANILELNARRIELQRGIKEKQKELKRFDTELKVALRTLSEVREQESSVADAKKLEDEKLVAKSTAMAVLNAVSVVEVTSLAPSEVELSERAQGVVGESEQIATQESVELDQAEQPEIVEFSTSGAETVQQEVQSLVSFLLESKPHPWAWYCAFHEWGAQPDRQVIAGAIILAVGASVLGTIGWLGAWGVTGDKYALFRDSYKPAAHSSPEPDSGGH